MVTKSEKQERRIAKEMGGRRQAGSGAPVGCKRDVKTHDVLIETKTTERLRHRIILEDLEFLKEQAVLSGRVPLYIVEFNESAEVAVVPEEEFYGDTNITARIDLIDKKGWGLPLRVAVAIEDGEERKLVTTFGDYLVISYEKARKMWAA